MNVGLVPFFRRFELPWAASEESEHRFKRLLRNLLIVLTVLAILIALLPMPERPKASVDDLPERVVQLIVEKPKPPPPPPPPEPETQPEPDKPKPVETPKPVEKPKPNVRNQGMLALADELEALRDQVDIVDPQMKAPTPDARSERNLITSQAGRASGGINTSNMSRGFGGGAGAIGTHTTTQVQHGSGLDPNAGGRVQRTGTSGKASRSREEVELLFDRNKGALYSIYGRALRDKPELQGKLVLEFTISPSGEISNVRVVSSELQDPELEKKIVARVRQFRFKPADVEPLTVSKPIDFFPAA
jgi:periplasmic protein TonB